MKATKDHISLETATPLKDCGVPSKFGYSRTAFFNTDSNSSSWNEEWQIDEEHHEFPAFTWGEILWEHAEKFFGDENPYEQTQEILFLIQQKKYDKADLYFRQNCILIPHSTNE